MFYVDLVEILNDVCFFLETICNIYEYISDYIFALRFSAKSFKRFNKLVIINNIFIGYVTTNS